MEHDCKFIVIDLSLNYECNIDLSLFYNEIIIIFILLIYEEEIKEAYEI